MSENKIMVFGGSGDVADVAGVEFWFGRSIGATHYCENCGSLEFEWLKSVGKIFYVYKCGEWIEWANVLGRAIFLIPSLTEWSIHNNDKPLSQLTDEQYGKMRRAEDAGGVVEIFAYEKWYLANSAPWKDDFIYRIKQKSERDEWIESVERAIDDSRLFKDDRVVAVSTACFIFDAIQRGDIKAPEVSK